MVNFSSKSAYIMVLLLLISVSATLAHAATGEMKPAWRVGDRWVVEVSYYLSIQPKPSWSLPEKWEYKVTGEEVVNDRKCYVLEVDPYRRKSEVKAWFYFDVKDLACLKMKQMRIVKGQVKYSEMFFNTGSHGPVSGKYSVIPYAFPAFPILKMTERTKAVQTSSLELTRKPGNSATGFSEKVTQTVRAIAPRTIKSLYYGVSAPLASMLNKSTVLYEIKVYNEKNVNIFTQVWADNLPWWVSHENSQQKASLVDYIPAK